MSKSLVIVDDSTAIIKVILRKLQKAVAIYE
jgi:hypothetical protein